MTTPVTTPDPPDQEGTALGGWILIVWLSAILGFLGGQEAGEFTGYKAAKLKGIEVTESSGSEHLQALVIAKAHGKLPGRIGGGIVGYAVAHALVSKRKRFLGLIIGGGSGIIGGGLLAFLTIYFGG